MLGAKSFVCQHLIEKIWGTCCIGFVQSLCRENVFDPQFKPHGRSSRAGHVYVSRMVRITGSAMVETDSVSLARSVCRFLYRFLCTIIVICVICCRG